MESSSSEKNSPRNGRRDRAEAWRLSTGDDIETALRAAERLLQQAEDRRRHEQNVRIGILSIAIVTFLSLIASILVTVQALEFGHTVIEVGAAVVGVVITICVLAGLAAAIVRQRRRVAFDYAHRLATQLSSMITEAVVDVAERERWSYLRLQSTRLRLSAFPLFDPAREYYNR